MNYPEFLLKSGSVIVALVLAWLGCTYLLPALLPFAVGGLVAALLRPVALGLQKATKMRYGAAAVAAGALFYGLFSVLAANLGFLLFAQTVSFFTRLPVLFSQSILPAVTSFWERSVRFLALLLPDAAGYFSAVSLWLSGVATEALSQCSAAVLRGAAGFAARLPVTVTGMFLGVLSSFFILMDYDSIVSFFKKHLPPAARRVASRSRVFLATTGKNVVKAYFLLLLLTFAQVSAGLWLLGVEYFAVLGIVVAVVDILPILGSGAVLVPWGLFLLVTGDYYRGAGILLLYGVVTVVRTFAEPKILGDRLGLPPLVTLLSMYLGLRLFGLGGMVLLPMATTLLLHLVRSSRQGGALP
ncbi:MAG: sporulation integral membrane protein YtvI [Angelakisella sp.]